MLAKHRRAAKRQRCAALIISPNATILVRKCSQLSCENPIVASSYKRIIAIRTPSTNYTKTNYTKPMNNFLKICAQRLNPAAAAFAAVPVLLYLPVLYYSLDTPFGILDDYVLWRSLHIFAHGFDRFYEWFHMEFFGYDWDDGRFKPFWDFYLAATWTVFGPIPWLHHLARWVEHFGAVAAFAAAFLCFQRRNGRNEDSDSAASCRLIRLMPLMALVYLWIFFPNQPASRLSPNVVHTVLFLGICVWMAALMLLRQGKPQTRRSELLIYAAFCVGFCGVAWSKEPNIGAALWLLISYYALPLIEAIRRQSGSRISAVRALKSVSAWKALGGLPLIAVFLHMLSAVYFISQQGGYGAAPLTRELLIDNAVWIAEGLFQVRTSLIIAVGLALLSAALLPFIVVNIAKRRFSDEIIFALFLLGLFLSLYLFLCTSWTQALRYWYPLIPVFTTLLAFSIKFILEFAACFNFARYLPAPPNLAAYALTAFIAFFICCNYYNFLHQTAVQRISRHNEANLIAEITRLLNQGRYVQVSDLSPGRTLELTIYFHEFLPWFYDREYVVHSEPPQETERQYYTVKFIEIGHLDTVSRLPEIEKNYRPLAYAYRVADFLQTNSPYQIRDHGAGITLWQIYDNEFNRIWRDGETLDVRQLVADAGSPIIRSDFDIYLNDKWLIYINERCSAANPDNAFFLGIFPVDNNPLPDARRPAGFENFGFDFADYGFRSGERCFAVRDLPEYPIKRIHTGQFVATQDGYHKTWEGDVELSSMRIGDAADIQRLLAEADSPIIRSRFDVYLSDDHLLIYTNNQCSATNLDDAFFLGVFPADNADLTEARKPHGFENFGFDFANHGFIDGERCFAVRQLPEYPIQRIHTGQFIVTEDGGYHNTWEGEAALSDE